MPVQVASINVAGDLAGTTHSVTWQNARAEPTMRHQAQKISDHIVIYNKSGNLYDLSFDQSGRMTTLSNGSTSHPIPVGLAGKIDISCTITCTVSAPSGPNMLLVDYYYLWEEVYTSHS